MSATFHPSPGASLTETCSSFEKEPDISPGAHLSASPTSLNANISPRDTTPRLGHGSHRRPDELAVLEASAVAIQSNRQHHPPKGTPHAISAAAAAAWTPRPAPTPGPSPAVAFPAGANAYGDPAEPLLPQLSPLSRPVNTPKMGPADYPEAGYFDDPPRRPSVASVATASSQGSQSSAGRGFHKKLQGFFGDEYRDRAWAPGPDGASVALPLNHGNGGRTSSHSHYRNNSVATTSTADGRTASPHSRPRTPIPSSEVTPWVYQDSEVSAHGASSSSAVGPARTVALSSPDGRSTPTGTPPKRESEVPVS